MFLLNRISDICIPKTKDVKYVFAVNTYAYPHTYSLKNLDVCIFDRFWRLMKKLTTKYFLVLNFTTLLYQHKFEVPETI